MCILENLIEVSPMSRSKTFGRGLPGWLGTLFFALLFVGCLVWETRFSLAAKHGHALVISSYVPPKGGPRIAQVEHRFDDQKIHGEIVAPFWQPRNGEVFPTVYISDNPTRPRIDFFWRRYMHLIVAGSALLIVVIGEAMSRQSKHRSENLDRRFAS
jgi:hypothetical protein